MSRFLVGAIVTSPRIPKERTCIICRKMMPACVFARYPYTTKQGKRSERLESRCKVCNLKRRMAQHERHRERENQQHRIWAAGKRHELNQRLIAFRLAHLPQLRRQRVVSEQKRRLRGYNRSTKSVRIIIEETLELARFGDRYLDAYSGEFIERPTIDHIIPLSRGGEHVADNVCVTSFDNNRSKRATPLLLWLLRRRLAA